SRLSVLLPEVGWTSSCYITVTPDLAAFLGCNAMQFFLNMLDICASMVLVPLQNVLSEPDGVQLLEVSSCTRMNASKTYRGTT
nr:hypothetical protein [Dehalococcoidia bacterium]